jgi:transcriptional antiterminator NusG
MWFMSSRGRRTRCTTISSSGQDGGDGRLRLQRRPADERVSEIKRGKKTETTRKFFPGYLIVNMWLFDEKQQLVDKTWYFIRETTGVIGFAGTKDRPIAMRPSEVEGLLAQVSEREDKVKPKITFGIGEMVKVADGPFQNQSGVVEEIDPERGKLRVSVSIFGRSTPVELEYWQVERG